MRPYVVLVGLAIAACSHHPTAVRLDDIRAQRTMWNSQRPTDYTYDYELDGFFISYAGQQLRLEVRADTVRSATFVASGRTLAGVNGLPTIDALFDQAEAAAKAGSLKAVTYDARYGFPTRMDLAGPPDASGAVLASNLQP